MQRVLAAGLSRSTGIPILADRSQQKVVITITDFGTRDHSGQQQRTHSVGEGSRFDAILKPLTT